jgi:collagenase-like PrtC family protease
MTAVRHIELLAPARNLACGIEAVRHGADAVYIGAPKFGARSAAGNSMDDIARLVDFAHLYHVRIYVTVNIIFRDEELSDVRSLVEELYRIGVDALIVQDMSLLEMKLPPIPLHASTQMDNRTVEKVKFLSSVGFRQVVLARELSLDEIKKIHEACPEVTLEAFVHGALCVSYSGQCYASEACFHRSANRGECAQFCRLAFDMVDAEGRAIACDKHLLSLKDMNRSARLEEMLDAGVTSFKIEGRLKDVSYVKNITAYYRQQLDAIFVRRKEFVRSSSGRSTYTFKPQADKSFNRGFTTYFLDGRGEDILSPDTPKSIGEPMGVAKGMRGRALVVAGLKAFHNGDGVCFFDSRYRLQGFRVNKVEGNSLYTQDGKIPAIEPHTPIYRNYDQEFERTLAGASAVRKIGVSILFRETAHGFACDMNDEENHRITLVLNIPKEKARSPQRQRIADELSKLGNTPFAVEKIEVEMKDEWFVPASAVSDLRRRLADGLVSVRLLDCRREPMGQGSADVSYPEHHLTYLGNVSNAEAARFYRSHGVTEGIDKAFELQEEHPAGTTVMFCRHCLRYTMGWCPKHLVEKSPYKEPYALVLPDGRHFRLEFDCAHCQMKIIAL